MDSVTSSNSNLVDLDIYLSAAVFPPSSGLSPFYLVLVDIISFMFLLLVLLSPSTRHRRSIIEYDLIEARSLNV